MPDPWTKEEPIDEFYDYFDNDYVDDDYVDEVDVGWVKDAPLS